MKGNPNVRDTKEKIKEGGKVKNIKKRRESGPRILLKRKDPVKVMKGTTAQSEGYEKMANFLGWGAVYRHTPRRKEKKVKTKAKNHIKRKLSHQVRWTKDRKGNVMQGKKGRAKSMLL